MHIFRSRAVLSRQDPSYEERWQQADKGLILCWECGRKQAEEEPELAARAKAGELIPLSWKGGVKPQQNEGGETKENKKKKLGSLLYLAKWQGLRGDDLDLYTDRDNEIVCTKTKTTVIFTGSFKSEE